MKKILIVLCAQLLLTSTAVAQQLVASNKPVAEISTAASITPVVEPKYVDEIYQLVDGGNLILLETQQPVRNVKGGFTGGSITYVYGGSASPTRVNNPSPSFVMRLAADVNPASVILGLNQAKVTKNRELVMVETTGAISGFKDKGKRPENFELAFSPYGPNSIKITVVGVLEPGEYIIRRSSGKSALFGVNPANSK